MKNDESMKERWKIEHNVEVHGEIFNDRLNCMLIVLVLNHKVFYII